MFRLKVALCCLALCCAVSAEASTSRAFDFAYGVNQKVPSLQILTGVQTPGTTRVVLALGNIAVNGITIAPLATNTPLLVGTGGNAETVTPSAVNCPNPSIYQTCAFTATFTKSHVIGETVSSGSVGLAEAVNYEHKISGVVTIDGDWSAAGGANGTITGLLGWLNVTVYDARGTANAAALNWQVAGDGQAYQNIVISGGGGNTFDSTSGLSVSGSAVSCLPSGASQNGCLQSSDFTNFQAIYTALNTLAFSGNTKTAVTTTGARTAGNCPTWDASGNLINSAYTLPGCGASGGLSTFLGLSQSATPATEGQIPFVASGVWTGLTATPLVTAGAYGFHIDGSGNGYPYKLCRQVSGTSDTVTQADGGKCVNYTNATGVTVTYPAPTSSLYPALPITLIQVGGGTLTLTSVANFAATGSATNLTNLLTAGSTPQTPKSVEVLNDGTVLWLDNYNNGAGVASSVAVANVTSGTSTNAWVIGTGGSIAPSGSGTIQATSVTSAAGVPQINLAASGAGGVGGNLPPTNLDNGTNANSSTVWCGNGHWCTPPAGFSNPMSTIGDLIVGSTAGAPVRLGAGAVGTALLGNGAGVAPSWGAFLANPMTTAGDVIYGGVAGAPTRLTAGTAGYALASNGPGVAPSYQGFLAAGTGAVTRTSQDKDRDIQSVKDFHVIGDGSADDTANFQQAITTVCGASGGHLYVPSGTYKITSTLKVQNNNCHIDSVGQDAAIILWVPSGAGTTILWAQAFSCSSGTKPCADVVGGSLSNLSFFSSDTTFAKTAINVQAASDVRVENIHISGGGTGSSWSGSSSTGGIGLYLQGHDNSKYLHLSINADLPLEVGINPVTYSGIELDADQMHFSDLYLIANANPCVLIADGVFLSNDVFDGEEAWVLGTYGLYWNNTTQASASFALNLNNIRTEQGSSSTAYSVYVSSTSGQIQNVQIRNSYLDSARNGFYFRNAFNTLIDTVTYGGAGTPLNVTQGDFGLKLVNGSGILLGGGTKTGYTPTIAYGTGAGSNSTPTSATFTGSNTVMHLSITPSASPGGSAKIATVTYTTTRNLTDTTYACLMVPDNANAAGLATKPYTLNETNQTFDINSVTAMTSGTAYAYTISCPDQ